MDFTTKTVITPNSPVRLCCRCLKIFLNPPPSVTVHLLHDNTLTQDNRDKFIYIAGRYGQIIKFYNVEEICAEEIARINEIFKNYPGYKNLTLGAFCRLLTPKVIDNDIEKIIYFDSDLIVNLDIEEFWYINLDDNPIAAVSENSIGTISEELSLCKEGFVHFMDYFNSGVLFINLKHIRQYELENIWNGIKFLSENPQHLLFDQEILNYCFSKKYLKLPNKFNYYVRFSRKLQEKIIERRIYHYSANDLGTNFNDMLFKLWFSYFEKTPWFTKDVIGSLDEGFRKIVNQNVAGLKNFAIQVSAIMAGKERAFFTNVQNIDALKRFFFIREDEEIIPLENQESFNVLVNSMKNSLGKKIFLILFLEGYPQLRLSLINAGFVEGRDFINAAMFLSDANGVPLNTYELVKAM